MWNIAILDDHMEDAQNTKKLLLPYLDKRNLDYDRIDIYVEGRALLHVKKEYDMLFLDIEVGSENGIEVAKKLREHAPEMIIIVITSFIKYSIEGYKIQATRYLLKPVMPSLLYSELDEVLKSSLHKQSIIVRDNYEETRLRIAEIYYFESYGRKTQFHTRAQVFISNENVSNWAMKLSDFIECYKGVYVHIKYIEQVGKEALMLENKQMLPLARRRIDEVRKRWIHYQEMTL